MSELLWALFVFVYPLAALAAALVLSGGIRIADARAAHEKKQTQSAPMAASGEQGAWLAARVDGGTVDWDGATLFLGPAVFPAGRPDVAPQSLQDPADRGGRR